MCASLIWYNKTKQKPHGEGAVSLTEQVSNCYFNVIRLKFQGKNHGKRVNFHPHPRARFPLLAPVPARLLAQYVTAVPRQRHRD